MLKIVLGTAQFGLNYGITNSKGRVDFTEVLAIKKYAIENGITMVDTAKNYGNSERILDNFQSFDVVTKINLSQIADGDLKPGILLNNLKNSLKNLGRQSLYALLIHDPVTLSGMDKDFFLEELDFAKRTGLVKKYGISVYSPDEVYELTDRLDVELVQLPLNIFDQRFLKSGCLEYLRQKNIEVHSRSLFLQGALLASKTPNLLLNWDPYFIRLRERCKELSLSLLEYCIAFAKSSLCDGSSVVIGVTSKKELSDILGAFSKDIYRENWENIACDEIGLIDPRKWN